MFGKGKTARLYLRARHRTSGGGRISRRPLHLDAFFRTTQADANANRADHPGPRLRPPGCRPSSAAIGLGLDLQRAKREIAPSPDIFRRVAMGVKNVARNHYLRPIFFERADFFGNWNAAAMIIKP